MSESRPAREQHIAVFGESGSGKTVLLSSFYGATQEPKYLRESLFHVVAGDIGQGNRLQQNYLRMRNSSRLPETNRFSATSYSFTVKLKDETNSKSSKSRPIEDLRLVWHDYPGEWFETHVSGPEEAQRRVDTFRSLLGSDVALLLVDGQRLLDNAGEEERYLKSVLTNFRNGLLSLKDDVLEEGKPLVTFPRIWMMALSKSDLLPNMGVFQFRDLLIEKVSGDIEELRKVLAGFVEASDALSVGEDFVLLSSAKFDGDKIEVTERVGLELVLPLAAMLPFERHVQWAERAILPRKMAEDLLDSGGMAALLITTSKLPGPFGVIVNFIGPGLIDEASKLLKSFNNGALAKKDRLASILTRFRMDLDRGEEEQVLRRSLR